ncbi:MAG: hypothetical protein FH753_09960 [Firmicutes bacterium]|nr:hypothetical protein [Bacillota bacterium]
MKFNINKNIRKIIMIASIILIMITSFFLYREYKIKEYEEKKISLYSYNNKSIINYEVFLKPNVLYETESIGERHIYITEFVDYLNTIFTYDFKGEKEAEIKGNYEIVAVVEGYTGEGETYKSIWKKAFTLVSKKKFNVKDKKVSINQEVPIKFHEYNNFAKKVIEDSKIYSSVKLNVFMDVNLKANTDKGLIEEKITPAIEIPLNTNYFEIAGELSQDKEGSIEKTVKVELPVDRKKVISYCVLIGIFLIVLLFVLIFTKGILDINPLEKKLKKIFKSHGDRLVALKDEVIYDYEKINTVNSIDDLVRISDEIGKPIMYKYSENLLDITKFYVYDETTIYVLNLDKLIGKNEVEETVKNMISNDSADS